MRARCGPKNRPQTQVRSLPGRTGDGSIQVWRIESGPIDYPNGLDATNWGWRLVNDEGQVRTVRIHVSRTAKAADTAPEQTRRALETRGESVIFQLLDLDMPPKDVHLTTSATIRYEWEDGRTELH